MMQEFLELLKKRKAEQGSVDPKKMKAKAEMAKELSNLLGSDIAEGVKKVTVASDSQEGLEEGLEKAQEILESSSEESDEEMKEESEDSEEEIEQESEESMDLESQISELEEKIKQLKKQKK